MPLSPEDIKLIETWPLGFVATVTSDGEPRVSPKGTFMVLDDSTLAFGNIRSPGTMKNLQTNPSVEINFLDFITRTGCRVRGKASFMKTSDPRHSEILARQRTMWGGLANRITDVVLVDVEISKPLVSPPYDDGASRENMVAHYLSKVASLYRV